MNVGRRAASGLWAVVIGLLLIAAPAFAQKKPVAASPDEVRRQLVGKAHALESRGRPDMAVQLWQQILLSDPKNTEALAGMAKDYKLMGSASKAEEALAHLRQVNPNDPNIDKIDRMGTTKTQNEDLKKAGELAKAGKNDEAMAVYRKLYGNNPPEGEIALAYYQTLYGTKDGKGAAIAGLRALSQKNPGNSQYAIELAKMMTYDARTRAEGVRVLKQHIGDPLADAALRQALMWSSANPSTAGELRAYLKAHPQDTEVLGQLKQSERKLAQMNSGIARTPEERAAFAALNAHRLDEAQARFMALIEKDPQNGRMAAGMGFLRMQQSNFGGAISYLTQAEQLGYKDRTVESALATSRFWYTMGEATQSFDEGQLDVAAQRYQAALQMKPNSPEALNGLAGIYVKAEQFSTAATIYEQLAHLQPGVAGNWRGLFLAYARGGENQKALAVAGRMPAAVHASLKRDPEYLRTLAGVYKAQNRVGEAERVLAEALTLPFPDNGSSLKSETRLEYAAILSDAKRYQQAIDLYIQALQDDVGNVQAWTGMINGLHQIGQDEQALESVQKMPAAAYESAIADPGFLSLLGSLYLQANQFDVAQSLLERSARLETQAGGQPSIQLQMALAAAYLKRNYTEKAYTTYRLILQEHPDRIDAWKGLIGALLETNHNSEALAEIAQIPPDVRRQLETDIEFLQTEASLYAAAEDMEHALAYMARVDAHYAAQKAQPPANIAVQSAWLLFNTRNDRALYPALMSLGARQDLSPQQRETVQTIWANWSVRRAATALDNGNLARAVDILDAASQAFPENLMVRKAVAGGYAQVGRSKDALMLFKSVPMQDAGSGDFQGAIGAALGAGDKTQAEIWLRQALQRFPRDPAILQLAARFEEARGDHQRAAEFWRASLDVLPRTNAADKLAHTLVYPEQQTQARRAVTAADLANLLNPETEPFPKTTKLPPLPAYGHDPYQPGAPVMVSPTAPASVQPMSSGDDQPQTVSTMRIGAQQIVPLPAVSGQVQMSQAATKPSARKSTAARRAAAKRVPAPQPVYLSQPVAVQNVIPAGVDPQSAPVAHSMLIDSTRGLIYSLLADNKIAEATTELNKLTPELRALLETDVEFVQAEANLFAAAGDQLHATDYINRVNSYYMVRRMSPPASIALQSAWLSFKTGNERELYGQLLRLDQRTDLTADQQQQVREIWVDWTLRRASAALDANDLQTAADLLDAASRNYPDNPSVRRAVAGVYSRVGRSEEAYQFFRQFPMDDATAGDYQSAITAAMAVKEMGQAENWLRAALPKFPADSGILACAARFEEQRGDHQRATAFWRAALATLPKENSSLGLSQLTETQTGVRRNSTADLKMLLDPSRSSAGNRLSPLPGYRPATPAPQTPGGGYAVPQSSVPAGPAGVPIKNVQPAANASANPPANPKFTTPSARLSTSSAEPTFYEQSASQPVELKPARGGDRKENSNYTGQMNVPASEETVQTTDAPAYVKPYAPQSMSTAAARAQARFADLTDSQLTPDAPGTLRVVAQTAEELPSVATAPNPQSAAPQLKSTQYTPSAQEAASAAYAAPRQTTQPLPSPQQPVATPKPSATQPLVAPGRTSSSASQTARRPAAPRSKSVPLRSVQPNPQPAYSQPRSYSPLPGEGYPTAQAPVPAPVTPSGLSDQELENRNLPPLRGPWVRVQRESRKLSPRDEAELQLRFIESGYSPWLGASGYINYRSGSLGFEHLAALEAPMEASIPLGTAARVTFVAKPVFLDSGQADGSAVMALTNMGQVGLASVSKPLGSQIDTSGAVSGSPVPPQQNAAGLGGEIQLAWENFAIAGGYSPNGFLVKNFIGRAQWRPGNGPLTISASRDSVKDSQLSYSGLRDPGTATLSFPGYIWGGVIANQFGMQYARGDQQGGFYFGANAQYITGYNVQTNKRIDGTGGAYWRAFASPEYGTLSIGANFFGMHYVHNQNAFTWGMGGYFSPQAYFLGNAPVTWTGHYGSKWHYNLMGSLGVQAFQENLTPLFPLVSSGYESTKTITINGKSYTNLALPPKTVVGANYDLRGIMAYQISPHWYAGGFFGANNARNYGAGSAGFFVRFLFRSQPATATRPTGLFPSDGFRPFAVP